MFEVERLRAVERECGFRYPRPFRAIAGDLAALASSAAFATAFPRGRLVAVASDIQSAWAGDLPDTLIPFMCQVQPKHTDYYCFDRSGWAHGTSVVVFAVHTVVHGWDDFDSFIGWVRQQCRALDAEPGAAPDCGGM